MKYIHSCPDDSMECTEQKQTTAIGWILTYLILLIFILPDVIDGAFHYYRCTLCGDIKGIITGLILISVNVITMVASVVYLNANSLSNAALLKDSVAILFLNELDGQVYEILRRLKPSWVERLEREIKYCQSSIYLPSYVASNANNQNRNQVQFQSIITTSVTSRVEATSQSLHGGRDNEENRNIAPEDVSTLSSRIESLNDQIRELHRVIGDLRQFNANETNAMKKDIKNVMSHICL